MDCSVLVELCVCVCACMCQLLCLCLCMSVCLVCCLIVCVCGCVCVCVIACSCLFVSVCVNGQCVSLWCVYVFAFVDSRMYVCMCVCMCCGFLSRYVIVHLFDVACVLFLKMCCAFIVVLLYHCVIVFVCVRVCLSNIVGYERL